MVGTAQMRLCPPDDAMTALDVNPRSRDAIAPELMNDPPRIERAQGKPGAQCTRSLAWQSKKPHEHSHYKFTELVRPSLRNGFNAYNVLSPVTGSFATVACASYRRLDSASGRQDHTISPSALAPLVNGTSASIASPPYVS
jgi:hypothetical protein